MTPPFWLDGIACGPCLMRASRYKDASRCGLDLASTR